MNSTKYITKKKSKLKVVMIFNDYSFAIKFENQYYYMRHYNDLYIKTKEDAYKVINDQGNFEIGVWSFKDLKESSNRGGSGEELLEAMTQLVREDKLKNLAKDE